MQKILKPAFVEARIHTDLTEAHPTYRFNDRIQEVRTKFLGEGNIGLPQYIVVDPHDPFRPLVSLGGAQSGETFRRFFKEATEKSQ